MRQKQSVSLTEKQIRVCLRESKSENERDRKRKIRENGELVSD